MIFILEGPDGAGKTRLARDLTQRYGLEYHHEGPPPQSVPAHLYYGKLLQHVRLEHTGAVFDRLYLGERIYGPILRGRDRLGDAGYELMRRLTMACNAIEIVCFPPYAVARDTWASGRSELFKDEEQYRTIFNLYGTFTHGRIVYDYTQRGAFQDLCGFIDHRNLRKPRNLPYWIVGSPTAQVLFVGERGSQREQAYVDLPFWGIDNSSKYLTDAVKMYFNETQVAFMNAYDMYGEANYLPTMNPNGQPWKIIALGKAAAKFCKKSLVGYFHYTEVPHPQFWRRFHHHDIRDYADLLKSAVNRTTAGY